MDVTSKVIGWLIISHCLFIKAIYALGSPPLSWFISAEAGAQKIKASQTSVNNGSSFNPPYHQDIYTVNDAEGNALLGLQVGHRWALEHKGLSGVSLSARYQYSHPKIQGNVIQFSLPQFTNYNYSWKLKSDLLLANGKVNFVSRHGFSPYINGGLGAVFSRGQYLETAFVGVTPRLSPNYHDSKDSQFAYALGAGVDYQCLPALIINVAYQYSNLGRLDSGSGVGSWSGQGLQFGHYHSQAILAGLTYFVG